MMHALFDFQEVLVLEKLFDAGHGITLHLVECRWLGEVYRDNFQVTPVMLAPLVCDF